MIFFTITGILFWIALSCALIGFLWEKKFRCKWQHSVLGKTWFYYIGSKKYLIRKGRDGYINTMIKLYPYFVLRKHLIKLIGEDRVSEIDNPTPVTVSQEEVKKGFLNN